MLAFLFIMLIVYVGSAMAARPEETFRYTVTADGEAEINGFTYDARDFSGTLTIPSQIGGWPVTRIGSYAFHRTDITEIVVPGSIVSIGNNAFMRCDQLTSVLLEDGLKEIGPAAFQHCPALTSVRIPDSVERIAPGAFKDCEQLAEVRLSEALRAIDTETFYGCKALSSITLPKSLEEIGQGAFNGTALSYVDLPESLLCIGGNAFGGCPLSEAEIILPEGLTEIGEAAFPALRALTIPASLRTVPSRFCSGRIEELRLAQDHPTLEIVDSQWLVAHEESGDRLVRCLHGSKEASVPDGITQISAYAMGSVAYEIHSLYLPESVSRIEGTTDPFVGIGTMTVAPGNPRYRMEGPALMDTAEHALIHFCSSNASEIYIVPEGTKTIAGLAFRGSSTLRELIISEGVERIGEKAFMESDIQRIVIPSTVCDASEGLLNGYGDKSLTVEIAPGAWNLKLYERDFFREDEPKTPIFREQRKEGSYEYFLYTDGTCCITGFDQARDSKQDPVSFSKLPGKLGGHIVRAIGPDVFRYLDVTSLTVPETVRWIGDRAFDNAWFEKISLADTPPVLGRDVFQNCTHLILPEKQAESWGIDRGPQWEYNLREDGSAEITALRWPSRKAEVPVEIDGHPVKAITGHLEIQRDSGEQIPRSTFYPSTVLQQITLPEGLEEIGDYALANLSKSVKKIRIPSTVTAIGKGAFRNSGFTEIVLPDAVTTLGEACFMDCHDLRKVTMGKGVTEIPAFAFALCIDLVSVRLPGGLVEIGAQAFRNTYKLKTLSFPASLRSIGLRAFYMGGLTKITLPEGVETIGQESFAEVNEGRVLQSVKLPGTLKKIPKSAFAKNKELTKVILGEGIEHIGEYAFYNCNLSSLSLPASMRILGPFAFSLNTSLKKVRLNEGLTEIQDGCFAGHELSRVDLPGSLQFVGQTALLPNQTKGTFRITVAGMETELHAESFCALRFGKKVTEIVCPEGSRVDQMLSSGKIDESRFKLIR